MLVLFLLPLLAVLPAIHALLNITVDDTDTSQITYQGAWEASSTHLSGLDYGGSHTLSSDSKANATFKFTGVAVYFLSPRWPYTVTTRLSIDGGPSDLVNLTDPNALTTPAGGSESAMYSVVWSRTNLANGSHTVLVTYGNYIVVDGFIFTVDNGSSPTSSSSIPFSSSSSPSSSSSLSTSATLAASSAGASTIPSGHKGLTIGLATALPLAALLAAALLAFAFCQRRRKLNRRPTRTKFILDDSPPAQPVYAAVSPAHRQMSDVSSSRVHSTYPSSLRSDPFLASSHAQMPSTTPSIASHPRGMENPRSMENLRGTDLPPGAMSPVPLIPHPYADRTHVPNDDLGGRSLPVNSSAVSGGSPLVEGTDLRRGISKPPAYSERK